MLNEIYALRRGLVSAGIEFVPIHPHVSSPGKTAALHLRLDRRGMPTEVMALEKDRVASLWRLSDGNHSSFPYVKFKWPLLNVPDDPDQRKADADAWRALKPSCRREHLRVLARNYGVSTKACALLAGQGFRDSLGNRLRALSSLTKPHDAVPSVIERVLAIEDLAAFARCLLARSLAAINEGDYALLEAVRILLVGHFVNGTWTGSPIIIDVLAGEFARDVADPSHASAISQALSDETAVPRERGRCVLLGEDALLHSGPFPKPTIPVLGPIIMFSKNADNDASHRYGHADNVGMPVGAELSQSLSGALVAITEQSLKGTTWRSIPGEKHNATDLLVVFVDGVPEAPVAKVFAGDEAEDDCLEEETSHIEAADREATIAAAAQGVFRARAERVVKAVKGKLGVDFRDTPVTVLVLRKIDKGNAKAILHRALTVGDLYDAAIAWAAALGNVPGWLQMPVPRKSAPPRQSGVPSLTPLQLPRLTRAMFIRGGTTSAKRGPVGITTADALTLFLGESGAEQIAIATLRMVLARQAGLLVGTAQALRRHNSEAIRQFDRHAALQAAGLIGVLLAKIGHTREIYMNSASFELGQILAAADVIHVGYCFDIRGGQIPPTLLGNSMLSVAYDDPQRALSMLCLRLKPYLSWGKQADRDKAIHLSGSKYAEDKAKGCAIKAAISQLSSIKDVARSLASHLPVATETGDTFRAELLLGYVAGLPEADCSNEIKNREAAS